MNIANSVSIFRFFLAAPLAYTIYIDSFWGIIIVSTIAFISDYLDGYLARKLNQVTEMGKVLDPIADKAIVGASALVLIIKGTMPLWFGIAILARDILIMIGGLYASKKLKFVIPSNKIGKLTVNVLALVIIGLIFHIEIASTWGIWIATFFLILSISVYTIGMIKQLKNANQVEN